jgi:hypothetical protein
MTTRQKENLWVAALLLAGVSIFMGLVKYPSYQGHTNRAEHNAAAQVQRQR